MGRGRGQSSSARTLLLGGRKLNSRTPLQTDFRIADWFPGAVSPEFFVSDLPFDTDAQRHALFSNWFRNIDIPGAASPSRTQYAGNKFFQLRSASLGAIPKDVLNSGRVTKKVGAQFFSEPDMKFFYETIAKGGIRTSSTKVAFTTYRKEDLDAGIAFVYQIADTNEEIDGDIELAKEGAFSLLDGRTKGNTIHPDLHLPRLEDCKAFVPAAALQIVEDVFRKTHTAASWRYRSEPESPRPYLVYQSKHQMDLARVPCFKRKQLLALQSRSSLLRADQNS